MDTGLLALALVAGAVAAFNPCGFALLPAYLTVLLADTSAATVATPPGGSAAAPSASARLATSSRAPTSSALATRIWRALRFAAGMTVGFVAVFGLFGLIVTPLALSIERYLPYVTVVIGIGLVVLGGWLTAGHSLAIPGLAGRGSGPTRRWASQIGYGVTFALASLSCTIGPFLAVTSSSLRGGSAASVVGAFIAYALGMGTVVLILALAVATASGSLTTRMRRAGPVITRFSGLLLVIAGAYVAWYGWFEIRILRGEAIDDPIVGALVSVQAQVTRFVATLGAGTLLILTGLVVGAVIALLLGTRRHRRPR